MKYILSEHIALRSWRLVPYAYYIKGGHNAQGLKADEYELLRHCDGLHELEDSALSQSLISRGLCRPAKDGETLSEWQKEKVCDNHYFPAANRCSTRILWILSAVFTSTECMWRS